MYSYRYAMLWYNIFAKSLKYSYIQDIVVVEESATLMNWSRHFA